jgi:hypothetical protein
VILKIVTEADYDTYTGENRSIEEKPRRKLANGRKEKLDIHSDPAIGKYIYN